MITAYAVRSERQRGYKKGQFYVTRDITKAAEFARDLARMRRKRMYVVLVKIIGNKILRA